MAGVTSGVGIDDAGGGGAVGIRTAGAGTFDAGSAGERFGVGVDPSTDGLEGREPPVGLDRATAMDPPNSSRVPSRVTVMTPPHTAQRARTMVPGILPGSIRKIDRHSGQETFTDPPGCPSRQLSRP
jgi:hypothetical protein